MKILIIVLAYNEESNIERVVKNLIMNYPQYDYIVVNDGSIDNTAKKCINNEFNLINLPINLGISGAFQAGIKYAYINDYDAALQFDGDDQHNPIYIKKMLDEMLISRSDIVIGSRFKDKKKPKGIRMLGSSLIQLVIRITSGQNVKDPTSGMRLYNKKMIKEFANNMNFGPEPDTISYLIRNGVMVSEVQVEMNDRISGTSYLNIKTAIKYMIQMFVSIILIQGFRERG